MRLMQVLRPGAAAQVVTLDELWREAEGLGRVNVDAGWDSDHPYKVDIKFRNSAGSLIWARGTAMNIHDALLAAITEAKRLR